MKLLEGKVALVTGAGSGIGRAIAILFAKEGAKVFVVCIDPLHGHETVEAIRENGGMAEFISADMTRSSDVEHAIRKTINIYARLDILVNNAGITQRFMPIEEIDEGLWEKIMAVNLKSIFLACKHAIPIMKKQHGGVIINTASISGVRPRPNISAYVTSKGGVILLTKALAIELAPYNIRANCISPVASDTPMLRASIGDENFEEVKKAIIATIPLGRIGKPEDMAHAALYLASNNASFVTGVNLEIDGGRGI